MAKKIDRSVRIVRALSEVKTSVSIEQWEHDNALLADLISKVELALQAAHAYADAKEVR
jgi:hypothetical protein